MPLDDLHRWIAPLGWTLLHFAWQGVALALVAGAAMTLAASARVRYAIGCAAIVAMLACPIATLAWIGPDARAVSENADSPPRLAGELARRLPDSRRASSPAKPVIPTIRQRLDRTAPALVATWIVGVAIGAMYHVVGLAQLARLRRRATRIVDAAWTDRVSRLSARLRLRSRVALLLTDRLDCPAVVGLLRPAMLWPASALTGLTPAQIDALLAHELAHVRRHDYAANLVQTLVETLLFYHPAVWWLSRRVRQEREHCCDDLAASVVGDRATYAGALVAMESLRATPPFAIGAGGGSLLTRVRRLLAPTARRRPSIADRGTVVAMLCLTLAMTAWSAIAKSETASTQTTAANEAIDTRIRGLADDDPEIAMGLIRLVRLDTPLRTEVQPPPNSPKDISVETMRNVIHAQLVDRVEVLRRSPELWDVGLAGKVVQTKQRIVELTQQLATSPPLLGVARDQVESKLRLKQEELANLFGVIGEYSIGGHVQRPGVYSLTNRAISLRQALVSAGIEPKATGENWIDVVIQDENREMVLRFAFSDLLANRHEDFRLLPNDLVIAGVNFVLPATQPVITKAASSRRSDDDKAIGTDAASTAPATTGPVSALDGQLNDRNNRE